MDNAIDLHVHSTISDGTFTPMEIVELAKDINLSAISLTDHDSVLGIKSMRSLCALAKINFIPGVELSTDYNGTEVHILGYFIDETNNYFCNQLSNFVDSRNNRTELMLEKLRKNGFSISFDELNRQFENSIITRAHIAKYLYNTNQINSIEEAFNKYIGDDCPCFVRRELISSIDAIKLIHDANGIAFVAHPTLYHMNYKEINDMVNELCKNGLNGIEAIYSTYKNDEEGQMKKIARDYNLLISGGSDFHGTNKPFIHLGCGRGNLHVPTSVYDNIVKAYFS